MGLRWDSKEREAWSAAIMPEKVPAEVIRKAFRGRVSWLKVEKRLEAPTTASAPRARPAVPPRAPPLRVALVVLLGGLS